MKCPNCGSSAQVRILNVMICDTYVQIDYKCGCLLAEGEGDITGTSLLTLEQYNKLQEI